MQGEAALWRVKRSRDSMGRAGSLGIHP